MITFLWSVSAASSLIAAVFFLRFWTETRDRLFACLTGAFAVLAMNYTGLAIFPTSTEAMHLPYVIRLVAFILIIVGIVDKNMRPDT